MRHFKLYEFDSPDLKGSGQLMDETFLSMIDGLKRIRSING